ncbi:Beta-lactamase/transpeptidase-like protein [Niveomyces insectorum RCEF 264]|uniref:Beta-lactamase/transpeptidase-like protein n=1 Tax=Niveomyces insectorum RCEF 264 TaxID=1081102 RepID=A0A167NSG0_9HYPO|nr:Beta-lactamase/transpeptidase-like protein [Niveomyces insectorum RCEF 264]
MKPTCLFALVGLVPAVAADFATGSWPPPADLASNGSIVAKAFRNISATLEQYIADDGQPNSTAPALLHGVSNLTFSLGVFSLYDAAAADALQFHHTGPEIALAVNGTRSVDADSIYRVASVTKVLTTLAGLTRLTPADWERSLADIFPVLVEYERAHPGGTTAAVDWSAVTLRSLAAQISGVPRDGFPSANELLIMQLAGQVDPASLGLPPDNASDPLENPACLAELAEIVKGHSCSLTAYLESVANRPPTFAPWTSPGYANNGFALLGLALANLTNTTYPDLVHDAVFAPLGMASSSVTTPPLALWNRSVIADSASPTALFDLDAGVVSGSGSALSTQRDMARLGLGILGSKLLSPDATRRWLKPVSFTGRLQYAVGAPWEIHRFTLPSSKVVDLYTKSGDSGGYSAFLVLLPDYGLGFSLLSASSELALRFDMLAAVADVVTNTLVPAIDAQAAAEAAAHFAGTYASDASSSSSSSSSSSLTLVVNQTGAAAAATPGLVIANWTSNGTDVLASPLVDLTGLLPWRLVPSMAGPPPDHQPTFRMVTGNDAPASQPPVGPRLFSGVGFLVADWVDVGALTYGGIDIGLFEFDVGSDGKAESVTPAAFRETLHRVAS